MRDNEFLDRLYALQRGETVEFQGMTLIPTGEELAVGVDYYAARNTGQFFTVKSIDHENGWVYPVGFGYPFNTYECVPVRLAE